MNKKSYFTENTTQLPDLSREETAFLASVIMKWNPGDVKSTENDQNANITSETGIQHCKKKINPASQRRFITFKRRTIGRSKVQEEEDKEIEVPVIY